MSTVDSPRTRTEGNVIHADFGGEPKPEVLSLPLMSARCEIVYQDAEVALTRTVIQLGKQAWVTHGIYPVG